MEGRFRADWPREAKGKGSRLSEGKLGQRDQTGRGKANGGKTDGGKGSRLTGDKGSRLTEGRTEGRSRQREQTD